MKKNCIAAALLIIGIATFISSPSYASPDYFSKLDKDLIENTLTIKSENPKSYDINTNGQITNYLSEIILGIIHQKYDLGYHVDDNSHDSVSIYGTFSDEYTKITFTKNVCDYAQATNSITGEQYATLQCENPETLRTIDVKYTGINNDIKAKVAEASSNIYGYKDSDWSSHKRYTVDGLSFINYIISTKSTKGDNTIINYSEEYKRQIANKNISVIVDNRAGDGWQFGFGAVGVGAVLQNGYIYDSYEDIGGDVEQVLYIPENTEESHEAYISAAQERVNSYLKNTEYVDKLSFRFGGNIATDFDPNTEQSLIDHFGFNETEYYILSYEGNDYNVILHKDDKKIKTPSFTTVDTLTNIEIISNDSAIPLDSMAEVSEINTSDRKTSINKLKLKKAKIYDIKIHSDTAQQYIEKSANGFTVKIPVSSDLQGKKLAAYYCDQYEKCKTHDVTIKDGYATFMTDHFSEYILGTTDEAVSNPATTDNIALYIISLLSFTSFGIFVLINKK